MEIVSKNKIGLRYEPENLFWLMMIGMIGSLMFIAAWPVIVPLALFFGTTHGIRYYIRKNKGVI